MRFSRKDIEALKTMNGDNIEKYRLMMVIAYGHYRNDLFRFSKHMVIFLVGVASMIAPPQVETQPVSAVGIIVTGGLFSLSILLVLASTLDRRQREAMEEM